MRKEIRIEGMICHNCVRHVKDVLAVIDGVTSVDVNLNEGRAIIECGNIKDDYVKDRIEDLGYQVVSIESY